MLSERRDKKKWSVNPNGTIWSQDTNKFGTKMLEKMGWTQGKGLGANEDGCTDHIKVKKKNDNLGVGCSTKEAHNWIAHQNDFSSLLTQLNDHHSDKTEESKATIITNGVSNLDKHSKSQKRVHYHKFTRGKDLSNYGDHDLAAIFGKKASKSAPATPVNLSEGESSGADSSASCPEKKKRKKVKVASKADESQSNHITSTVSIHEYFAKRMAALKNKGLPMSADATKDSIEDPVTGPADEDQVKVEKHCLAEKLDEKNQDEQKPLKMPCAFNVEDPGKFVKESKDKTRKKKKKKTIAMEEKRTETTQNLPDEQIFNEVRKKKNKSKLKSGDTLLNEQDNEGTGSIEKKKSRKRKRDKISSDDNSPGIER